MENIWMVRKKVILWLSAIIMLVLSVAGLLFLKENSDLTLEQYQSKLTSLVQNTRSGQERWQFFMQSETEFIDLCTGYYSARFREVGDAFVLHAHEFNNLRLKDDDPARAIMNFTNYQDYFAANEAIGKTLIAFADNVEAGDYHAAIAQLEHLLTQYETLPNVT